MRVYLVQHGQAKSEEDDPDRPLTDRGVLGVRRVIRLAGEVGPIWVERVIHSGKTRARQTAEAWSQALGAPLEESVGLAPLDDPSIWAGQIAQATESLMLVGHMPHLARLAGLLTVGETDRTVVSFAQGAVVGLERVEGRWSVCLVLPPGAR